MRHCDDDLTDARTLRLQQRYGQLFCSHCPPNKGENRERRKRIPRADHWKNPRRWTGGPKYHCELCKQGSWWCGGFATYEVAEDWYGVRYMYLADEAYTR